MSRTEEIIKKYEQFVMPTYSRTGVVFVKGRGCLLWDAEGKRYLDFFPGWAVSGLGHCHSMVTAAIRKQAGRLVHISNNFYTEQQPMLAAAIVRHSFAGKVFFANSGAEANEAAIKITRKYGSAGRRYEIITMEKSFHGRTMAMITATGQDKVKHGFEPLLEGFKTVPFNDIEAVRRAISEKTVAVMVEPIQGEGGINVADKPYMKQLKGLCDKNNMLLIFDEVQTGMGRTGEMFCFKHFNVQPDVMTLAKSLGNGVPIGAALAAAKIADTLGPGTHASTFGGGPLVSAAGLAVFEAIEKHGLLDNAKKMGEYLRKGLEALKDEFAFIKEIRGMALMLGVELSIDGKRTVEQCLDKGLLINCTQGNVLRIMPPLVVTKQEIDEAVQILRKTMRRL